MSYLHCKNCGHAVSNHYEDRGCTLCECTYEEVTTDDFPYAHPAADYPIEGYEQEITPFTPMSIERT